jgi:hypothetical protein
MDRCFLCQKKNDEPLWYTYPIPGLPRNVGLKLCPKHQELLRDDPQKFKEEYIEISGHNRNRSRAGSQ